MKHFQNISSNHLHTAVRATIFLITCIVSTACSAPPPPTEPPPTATSAIDLPTLVAVAELPTQAAPTRVPEQPPATWTPQPTAVVEANNTIQFSAGNNGSTNTPPAATNTPLPIPSNTPIPPTLTPSLTPTIGPTPTEVIEIKPISAYRPDEVIPYQAFPRPRGDNGWGVHWMPTVSQGRGDVDRFIAEVTKMHIKWVVFLNDHTNIGDNDYLVQQLVANDIMPIMRLYRDSVLPYDGDLGALVRHYRAMGVHYFQLYNEPNVNIENNQGAANPNAYAVTWAAAARDVINNGGLPGLGALSPGGEYNHLEFMRRTLRALKFNGDDHLLNHTWISLHNYHGTRPIDDLGGFLMFRVYNEIVVEEVGRSLPIIGTEGGSYSENEQHVTSLLAYQYTYMRDAEPYYFVFSHWLLANRAGGGGDSTWEWQALFREGYTHPVVADFFYKTAR